jgi:sulfur carrier protein
MQVWINGQARSLAELEQGASVEQMIAALAIKADRVAVEQNGEIVPRAGWSGALVCEGDRFEIVHFVGGGAC